MPGRQPRGGPPSLPQSKTILVTGSSTGIGRDLTERLAALGHQVFATARRRQDLAALGAIAGVIPVPMDIRDSASVEAARDLVERHGSGLDGLVNNAGVGGIGPISAWREQDLRDIFEVNALGPIRTVQAFLPLLLTARGRIVNVGSQGGSISSRYYGPYTMTKHALEALTVSLSDELRGHGVQVSIVQPGGVATAIGDNSHAADLERFRSARSPFDREAAQVLAALLVEEAPPDEEPESADNRKPSAPELVSVAVLDALFAPVPRARYLVGTRWEGGRVLDALIGRLLDANEGPSLKYSRDELVALLDAAIQSRGRPNE